jgi:hypothetical protein
VPAATTHAAAVRVADLLYVIGGRGAALGTATARIVAVDARTHRVRPAGSLGAPRSDSSRRSAVAGTRILLAGGRGRDGAFAGVSELVAAPSTHQAGRTTAARNVSTPSTAPYRLHRRRATRQALVYVRTLKATRST